MEQPFGTRPSLHASVPLVSTGIASLDEVLGGGLPLGNVLLIKEDRITGYSSLLLKYFIAQGITLDGLPNTHGGHHMLVASSDNDPNELLEGLMGLASDQYPSSKMEKGTTGGAKAQDEEDDVIDDGLLSRPFGAPTPRALGVVRARGVVGEQRGSEDERMKIAWRYNNMPQFSSEVGKTSGSRAMTSSFKRHVPQGVNSNQNTAVSLIYAHTFDLTKSMPAALLESARTSGRLTALHLHSGTEKYGRVLEEVSRIVGEQRFETEGKENKARSNNGVLRIAIQSIGSPCWSPSSIAKHCQEVFSFLVALQIMIRDIPAACVVTLPAYMYGDCAQLHVSPFVRRIEHAADAVIELESFAGSKKPVHPAYAELDYHGLVHIHKLPRLQSLRSPVGLKNGGDSLRTTLAFKCRRKRFQMETIHLPPEIESDSDKQNSKEEQKMSW
ncbi:Elongator complex protein 4 [Cladochytrium replicatum]|nr:Elongator complex protein 4 [Cladochytrium replicatum]